MFANGGEEETSHPAAPAASEYVCRFAHAPFRVLYAGPRVGRYRLSGRGISRCARSRDNSGGPTSSVTFFYGTCNEAFGCFPGPVNVSVLPLDECHTPHPRARVRGVPARIARGGLEVDLYTGKTSVEVVGTDQRAVAAAIRALHSAPRSVIAPAGRGARLVVDPGGPVVPHTRLPSPNRALLRVPNSCA